MNEPIVVELVETNVFTRWPCHVCGDCTEKVAVLAEVKDGEYAGLRVCETCIEAGDIDARLAAHADTIEARAASLRALIGRLQVPSFAEWQRRTDSIEAKNAAWEKEFWDEITSDAMRLAASEMSDADLWQNTCDCRREYTSRQSYYIAMKRRGYRMPDLLPVEGDPMPERLATAPDLPPAA